MPTLELAIDARKATQGAREAEDALRKVTAAAGATEKSVGLAGTQINTAFTATSSGLSVARGVASTAAAFQQGSVAAAGFAASTALLDVSRLAHDFNSLRVATGGTATVMGTLANVIKSHPLLVIGTVISTAATLMASFGSSTKAAAQSWDDLATSLNKSRIDEQAAAFLGLSTSGPRQAQLDALLKAVSAQRANPQPASVQQLAGALGVSNLDLVRGLAGVGNEDALRYVQTGSFIAGTKFTGQPTVYAPSRAFAGIQASPEQIQALYRNFYRSLSRSPLAGSSVNLAGTDAFDNPYVSRPGTNFIDYGPGLLGAAPDRTGQGVFISDADRQRVEGERQALALERANEEMDRLQEKGRQFGETIGDAFFNVASGAQTARQAIAALISDLARAASRQAFGALFSAAAGATQTQVAQNAPNPGGSTRTVP